MSNLLCGWRWVCFHPLHTHLSADLIFKKKMEAPKGEMTCSKSQSWDAGELGFELGLLISKPDL